MAVGKATQLKQQCLTMHHSWIDPRSPYISASGEPTPRHSLVLFADILGFESEIRRAHASNTSKLLLARLREALTHAYAHLDAPSAVLESVPRQRSWDVKTFTDNLVVGYPVVDDPAEGEGNLGHILFSLARFQLELVLNGFFIRGGFALGPVYMDRDIVWGEGLLAAIDIERDVAQFPRIVLSDSLKSWVIKHLTYYATIADAPQDAELLVDADGNVFVDYLDLIFKGEDLGVDLSSIAKHRDLVTTCLVTFATDPKVTAKYSWVASYHNFCCREADLEKRFFIKLDNFQFVPPPPSRFSALLTQRKRSIDI